MINKIKDVLGLKKQIEDLEKSFSGVKKHTESIVSEVKLLKQEFNEIKSETAQHKSIHNSYADELRKMDKDVCGIVKRMNDSANNLNLVARQMPGEVFSQLRDELRESIKKVKLELDSYNTLKDEMNTVKKSLKEFNSEMSKFMSISSRIKAADFELVQHKKNLDSNDREKLALMKKIDTLERLVSKMRRRGS
jgi:chromosome segregation ATPase